MGRHGLWWLALPLVAGEWLSVCWLLPSVVGDGHEPGMVLRSFGAMHLCAACVLMVLALLVVLLIAGPALVLADPRGCLIAGRAPRPRLALSGALPVLSSAPQLARPRLLDCGHGERAPPLRPMSA